MKRAAILIPLTAALALVACQGETEEAPDIVEAIPLDPDPAAEGDAKPTDEGQNDDAPALPSTMESGANPPGMAAPEPGGKLQPAQ